MTHRDRRSFLSLLPLPLLAGWYLSTQPPEGGLVEARATAQPQASAAAAPASLYPPPQVDPDSPPEDQPPTF